VASSAMDCVNQHNSCNRKLPVVASAICQSAVVSSMVCKLHTGRDLSTADTCLFHGSWFSLSRAFGNAKILRSTTR